MKRLTAAFLLLSFSMFGCAGGIKEAKPAPDFSVKLMTGEEVSLAQFKGRPLVLNFGASWCPHCLHELPILKETYDKYKGRVEFLSVFVKSPREDVQSLIDKDGVSFKVGFDPDAVAGKAYGVKGIPETFFIDEDGNIVDDYFGGIERSELTGKIEMLLKKK